MAKRLIAKHLRYAVEGAMVAGLFVLFRIMPLPLASCLAGALAGTVGPLLPLHARARRNLHRAMPELPPVEVERALREVLADPEVRDYIKEHFMVVQYNMFGDEEVTDLMRYQRAFQATSKVISVLDQLLETVVVGLVR